MNETGRHVKTLRTDNGLEFVNEEMQQIAFEEGIRHERTVAYTPEQNGKAERENRTLTESARTMLQSKNLDKRFWAEAVNTAAFVLNRSVPVGPSGETPYELWCGKRMDIKDFKNFGDQVFTHIPKQRRRKWDAKAKSGTFVGYDEVSKGYRIWSKGTNKIEIHRDVYFKRKSQSEQDDKDTEESKCNLEVPAPKSIEEEIQQEQQKVVELADSESDHDDEYEEPDQAAEVYNQQEMDQREERQPEEDASNSGSQRQLRNRNQLKPPARYGDTLNSLFLMEGNEPKSLQEALESDRSQQWKEAMDEELAALQKNQTWILTKPPEEETMLPNRWVFKVKLKDDGTIDRYRARLVVKGFLQRPGLDYFETFSPVVKFDSVRMLLALAAARRMHVEQFDVKTAFLYGELEEDVYMEQPAGFEDGSGKVCKLKRSLYGLKQSSRCWNERFIKSLKAFNLKQSEADPCVFVSDDIRVTLYIAIYIDDGLVVSSDKISADKLIKHLQREFEIKISPLGLFLGMQINRQVDGSIFVGQQQYLGKVLERFHMERANSVTIPADNHQSLGDYSDEGHESRNFPFREAVGSLLFIANVSRPDIAYAVNSIAQFSEKPLKAHWNAVKRIFKYLKGTRDFGIIFNSGADCSKIVAYSDADFAGETHSRKSTTGYVLKLGKSPFLWGSRRQRSVALSTMESEYVAASETVREIVWAQRLFIELAGKTVKKPILRMDNQSAIKLIRNPEFHRRSKHIEIKFHFVRDKYAEKEFILEYVNTKDQEADILMKPLARVMFEGLRAKLNVYSK